MTHSAFCFCAVCRGETGAAAAAQYARDATLDRNEWEEDQEILQQTRAAASNYEEETQMKDLPAASGGRTGKAITRLPDAQSSGGGSYLKSTDIAQRGTTSLTVAGNVRESTGQYGAGIDCDVQIGKKKFTFTVKFASGNYPRLLARFGNNPAKWKGKVKVCRAQHLGKDYVQIVD